MPTQSSGGMDSFRTLGVKNKTKKHCSCWVKHIPRSQPTGQLGAQAHPENGVHVKKKKKMSEREGALDI